MPGLAMLLAHTLAATMMFWWARRGAEMLAAARRLLTDQLGIAWPTSAALATSPPAAAHGRRPVSVPPLPLDLLRHAVARRGPPRSFAACLSWNVPAHPGVATV
jgi:hypothetical protein